MFIDNLNDPGSVLDSRGTNSHAPSLPEDYSSGERRHGIHGASVCVSKQAQIVSWAM
jgi:hypothetical protein